MAQRSELVRLMARYSKERQNGRPFLGPLVFRDSGFWGRTLERPGTFAVPLYRWDLFEGKEDSLGDV